MARTITDPQRIAHAMIIEAARKREVVTGEVQSVPPLPFIPSETTLAIWEGFWRGATRYLVDPSADLSAVYSWIRAIQSIETLRDDYDANPTFEDHRGKLYENPVARRLAHLEKFVMAFEDRFGLSPTSRRLLAGLLLANPDNPDHPGNSDGGPPDLQKFLNAPAPASMVDLDALLAEEEEEAFS